jgi:hypothetical protein
MTEFILIICTGILAVNASSLSELLYCGVMIWYLLNIFNKKIDLLYEK